MPQDIFNLNPDVAALARSAAQSAVQAVVPPFTTMMPRAEAGVPAIGSTPQIPYADHQHPRLTATAKGTLSTGSGADAAVEVGTRIVTFTQKFDAEPAITITSIGAKVAGTAPPDFDFTFTQDGDGKYVGGIVYGRRARKLPTQPAALSPISVLALLGTVISGVNTLALSITGYDVTEPASGSGFSLIAVKSSSA